MRADRVAVSRISGGNPFAALSTMDLIPALLPGRQRPEHLAPVVAQLERAWVEPVEHSFSAPPQHWKTDTVSAFIVATLLRFPTWPLMYLTYSQGLAERVGAQSREWAIKAGIKVRDDTSSKSNWMTPDGGGLTAGGVHHGTGRPGRIVFFDDPYGQRKDAESAAYRRDVEDRYDDVAVSRKGEVGSIFTWHTRWTVKDLIAKLIARGVPHTNIPAISDAGLALLWSLATYEKIRSDNLYNFTSLFMGAPRPRGGALFNDVHTYDPSALPRTGLVYGIGVDLAYSSKTHADYSVAVTLARETVPANGVEQHFRYYVVDVTRKQCPAPEFAATLASLYALHPTAARRAYLAGTEKGTADFLLRQGVNVGATPPVGDKFIRAQPVAAKWNDGKILVPTDAPWVDAFVSELAGFTGVNDDHDDQVDALAAAFDVLSGPTAKPTITTSAPRQSAALFRGTMPGAPGSWRGGGA